MNDASGTLQSPSAGRIGGFADEDLRAFGPAAVWARRVSVIALYSLLWIVLTALFVPLAALAALVDVARQRPWPLVRTLVFFVWYLTCELAGVIGALAIWLRHGPWTGTPHEQFLERNYALQRWWCRLLGRGAFAIFGVRVETSGDCTGVGERPVIVLVRHSSAADTILASLVLAGPYDLRLRYVLKRELLWDPCLDLVGNRLPNVFVRRDSTHSARELASVAALGRNLGPREGVLIYPEGTRFSRSKRDRIAGRLREQGRLQAALEAESLRNVLRPRSGGTLALLEAMPGADVLVLAHTGLEASASFDRFLNGGLVGAVVRVQMRLIPREQIPVSTEDRRRWLVEQWYRVDAFVDAEGEGRA